MKIIDGVWVWWESDDPPPIDPHPGVTDGVPIDAPEGRLDGRAPAVDDAARASVPTDPHDDTDREAPPPPPPPPQHYSEVREDDARREREHVEAQVLTRAEQAIADLLARVSYGPQLAVALPPPSYFCEAIGLPDGPGAPHMIAGYGFSLKTFAAQSLALSLASGLRVWGAYACRTAKVSHVDLEQGERLTRRRYQRLALILGIDLAALEEMIALISMPRLRLVAGDRPAWRALMVGRDLLIVDSLRAASGGQDENDSAIRECLDLLGSLSEETGCRALVIHHARKTSESAPGGDAYAIRGSGAIFDACDSVYLFTANEGEPVSCKHVKARSHGEPVPPWALTIQDVGPPEDLKRGARIQVHGVELVEERRQARRDATTKAQAGRDAAKLRELLTRQPGLGVQDIRGALHLSGDRFYAARSSLAGDVEIRQVRVGSARPKEAHFLRSSLSSFNEEAGQGGQ